VQAWAGELDPTHAPGLMTADGSSKAVSLTKTLPGPEALRLMVTSC
jgi:hypothetical protein